MRSRKLRIAETRNATTAQTSGHQAILKDDAVTIKGLMWTIIIWVILTLLNYYYTNFFILAFVWPGLSLTLLILTIIQLVKAIKERRNLTKLRIAKLLVFMLLFILTFFKRTTDLAIEKVDWIVFEDRRRKVVDQVKNKELNPNVSWNGWVCELPFEFPIISNGGNDIGIYRNKENNGTTVKFWVFRNFFDSPSTYFIYTDDPNKIKELEKKVAKRPGYNWKIKENWYRTYGD